MQQSSSRFAGSVRFHPPYFGSAPKKHIHRDPTKQYFWYPLYWALEPECEMPMFMWSSGPLIGSCKLKLLLQEERVLLQAEPYYYGIAPKTGGTWGCCFVNLRDL